MDYITRLQNFDAPDIAMIAINADLFEEAFTIYKKYDQHVDGITVLLDKIGNLERAAEFADKVDISDVWTKLAKAQLDHTKVKDAIGNEIEMRVGKKMKERETTHKISIIPLSPSFQRIIHASWRC